MIFFCFSSKDRHQIVEAILFHITNYEIPVWYDRHQMLLGDERNFKNFDEGVEKANYAIIVLSPNAIASPCACEEIDLIYKRYQREQVVVFPIFFNILASQVPDKMKWMTKLVYKEINTNTDVYSACNHIICKVLLDELQKYNYKTINEFIDKSHNIPMMQYVSKLLKTYCTVSDDNRNAQLALLYTVCLFIQNTYDLTNIPLFYYVGVERLFDQTRLNLPIDLRETLIFERLTLLLINSVLFGHII